YEHTSTGAGILSARFDIGTADGLPSKERCTPRKGPEPHDAAPRSKIVRRSGAERSVNTAEGHDFAVMVQLLGASRQDHSCAGAIAAVRTPDGVSPKRRRTHD